ncbi:MAG: 1-acyl-sn-glycerol-3-phosphate acyltransferase [Beijerinckiaceae bacterium]|nr:1-acyl-sn-glycerol-3-phosphate acyltransferase [Beijerinckiaceae bacterium]
MLFIRSLIFNTVALIANLLFFIVMLPGLLLPYRLFIRIVGKSWMRMTLWLFHTTIGVRYEVRGLENLPPSGGYIVASKHQSAWETMAVAYLVPYPTWILKRELMWVPIFGWHLKKAELIPINRGQRAAVMRSMNACAHERIAQGRQVMIFPEGTRRPVGAPPEYKIGVAHLYAELGVACVPVAHNAGLCWPKKGFLKYPGKITIEIMPAIAPGLDKKAFFALLQTTIETASDRLIEEGRAYQRRSTSQVSVAS